MGHVIEKGSRGGRGVSVREHDSREYLSAGRSNVRK